MTNNDVVTPDAWTKARKELLEKEKALTRMRDEISALRRDLPWVKVEKEYVFEGTEGRATLGDLFAGRSQLIVQHFMFGPEWEEGCPSCSYWADNFNGTTVHLEHRDISLVAVSRAPLAKLQAYRERMGWDFRWVSSVGDQFSADFHVCFTPEQLASSDVYYNYRKTTFPVEDAPGVSVFYRDDAGDVFHTYSCYARGLDILNGAYHYMDLVPKGRDEAELSYGMAWLRRNDAYEDT